MTILKFSLKRIFKNPTTILIGFILPAALLLLTGMWDEDGRGYYFMAFILMIVAFPTTNIMLADQKERTVQRIMTTPTTAFKYLSQNLVACMIPLLMQIVFVCIFGAVRYSWDLQFTLSLGLAYTLFAATAIGFAFAWNCLFKNSEVGMAVLVTVMVFSAAFGIFSSPTAFPDVIRTAAKVFPTYWISIGIETLIDSGFGFEFLLPIGVLALFTSVFLTYGSVRGAY
ncbi:MAG: ABC transporter permease [Defluviitaleaceae bacterium]|nr:ABC transporter permease [Defluviitaleaceae bacterium]